MKLDINKDNLQKMAGLFDKLEGKPENQVIAEIAQLIKSGQAGITANKAKQMIRTILPMMDSNQRRKLEKLLRAL